MVRATRRSKVSCELQAKIGINASHICKVAKQVYCISFQPRGMSRIVSFVRLWICFGFCSVVV